MSAPETVISNHFTDTVSVRMDDSRVRTLRENEGAPYRVLVVDPNPEIGHGVVRILAATAARRSVEPDGFLNTSDPSRFESEECPKLFDVFWAARIEDAVAELETALANDRPYMMAFVETGDPPVWQGLDAVDELWNIDPSLHVLLCTSHQDLALADVSRRLLFTDRWLVLQKPIRAIEVEQCAHLMASKWLLAKQVRGEFIELEEIVSARTRALETINRQLAGEIEERRRAESELKHLATHDALTGLANRVLLYDRMSIALKRANRHGDFVACLMLDLDGFKEINDERGHDAGDAVLIEVAKRLVDATRSCDTVARLGGDEFVVILGDLKTSDGYDAVTQRILAELRTPVAFGNSPLPVAASIGVSVAGSDT